jgi:hypothetical protein
MFNIELLKIEPLKPPIGKIFGIKYRYGERNEMKKVYVVTSGDKSDHTINAVFSTKELADEYVAKMNTPGGDWEKPKALPLPSSIAGIEPPLSGFYTEKLMARRKNSQELLRSTLMKSAP